MNGTWNLRELYTTLTPDLATSISSVPGPALLDHGIQDTWSWQYNKKDTYNCSSGYQLLLQQSRTWDTSHDMRWIW